MMGAVTLYHMPGSCSHVALAALEAIGSPYEDRTVALMAGAQRDPAYLAINAKGKVPVLIDSALTLTELPVILFHLARRHPEAALLPTDADGTSPSLAGLSDLTWLAGVLQPLANRIFRPGGVAPGHPDEAKAEAIRQLAGHAAFVSDRIGSGWWHGDRWSIVDEFLTWIFGVAATVGFPLADYPGLAAHGDRTRALPPHRGARARERDAVARDGLTLPPGFTLD